MTVRAAIHMDRSVEMVISPTDALHPSMRIDELTIFFGHGPQAELRNIGHMIDLLTRLHAGAALRCRQLDQKQT